MLTVLNLAPFHPGFGLPAACRSLLAEAVQYAATLALALAGSGPLAAFALEPEQTALLPGEWKRPCLDAPGGPAAGESWPPLLRRIPVAAAAAGFSIDDGLLVLSPAEGQVSPARTRSFLTQAERCGHTAVSASPLPPNLHPSWLVAIAPGTDMAGGGHLTSTLEYFRPAAHAPEEVQRLFPRHSDLFGSQSLPPLLYADCALARIIPRQDETPSLGPLHLVPCTPEGSEDLPLAYRLPFLPALWKPDQTAMGAPRPDARH